MRDLMTLVEKAMEPSIVNADGRPIAFSEEALANFWRWFGRSRITDKAGRPKVVYHGTDASFSRFDPQLSNANTNTGVPQGSFVFSDHPEVASSYTVNQYGVSGWRDPKITAAFRELMKTGSWSDQMEFLEQHPAGYDDYKDNGNVMPCYLRVLKPLVVDAKNWTWNEVYYQPKGYRAPEPFTTNEIAQMAKEQGYDGAIIKNVKDMHKRGNTHEGTTIFVFSPSQIKSAISNTGGYRHDSEDIGESATDDASDPE